ncbi:MAG: threonine ammonia-lyase [Armatimonadota bacterium]
MRIKAKLLIVIFIISVCIPGFISFADVTEKLPVTLSDVEKAYGVIKGVAIHTPLVKEEALSKICGGQVYLKLENLQHAGSFKVRGAFNKIASLSEDERKKGVITASAGNHAQGVARAAKFYNIPATIVMPEDVPETKLEATEAFGAEVILYGKNFDQALAKAFEIQKETGATFVHPFDDPMTIAGQGTIGLEILHDLPDVDVVIIPVGGGGLSSGIAVALKGVNPSIEVIGVEPDHVPSMTRAFKYGKPVLVKPEDTIAEGTAVAKSGELTYVILHALMDKLITVSEKEIEEAIYLLLMKDKILTEGAGALGAAAILSGKLDLKGKNVVLIISGGNIDIDELKEILSEYGE